MHVSVPVTPATTAWSGCDLLNMETASTTVETPSALRKSSISGSMSMPTDLPPTGSRTYLPAATVGCETLVPGSTLHPIAWASAVTLNGTLTVENPRRSA